MLSCPQVLCIRGCWQDNIRSRIISTRWLPKCHHAHSCYVENRCIRSKISENHRTVGVVEFGDSGRCVRSENQAWASSQWEADNITNEKQRSDMWALPGLTKKRNCCRSLESCRLSSRISAKVSCSLVRPSPDSSSVCTNSLRLFSAPHKYYRRK